MAAIDPLVQVAFSLLSNRGAYALLLGSGISRPAGILTGHEVMLDLIRKVARLKGEPCEPEPEAWFRATFAEEPSYSTLLEQLGRTPAERQMILSPYFEPTPQELLEGLKVPTKAHHAIAWLMAGGYVTVAVTTNFDRLLEGALEAAGVQPMIVSSSDQARGLAPLSSYRVPVVVKVHGDYRDERIRNSPTELSNLDPEMNRLLDEVFDNHGVIVSGWSATYDTALRHALERSASRRYTTFWTTVAPPSEEAANLIATRQAVSVRVTSADLFFPSLQGSLAAMDRFSRADSLTVSVAVARTKRFLSSPRLMIDLEEMVATEADRVAKSCAALPSLPTIRGVTTELIHERLLTYEGITRLLCEVLATGGFYGKREQVPIWARGLRRAAPPLPYTSEWNDLTTLPEYPGLLLFYSLGVAAVAADRHGAYCRLLCGGHEPRQQEAGEFVGGWHAELIANNCGTEVKKAFTDASHGRTPFSAHVHQALQPLLQPLCGGERLYDAAFDRWETLATLWRLHCQTRQGSDVASWPMRMFLGPPLGCFAWRTWRRHTYPEDGLYSSLRRELSELGTKWPPLRFGLFDGNPSKITELIDQLNKDYHLQKMSL